MARKAISSVMDCENPDNQDPTMNPTMPTSMKGLRPNMSPSLPDTGMTTVEATRYAVVTHAYTESPLSSAMIRGIAVPTTVWSSATTRSVSMMPTVANAFWRVERLLAMPYLLSCLRLTRQLVSGHRLIQAIADSPEFVEPRAARGRVLRSGRGRRITRTDLQADR